ncbi:hypothetical protein mru_0803 [Methanobrevibacter ruminantium M1]|uniref:Uncharacterized protein n=1 Tax=Methanobrevibacter ruminantium (strain ATCC 35063 / DSM 1093 / JCM 13430 / OCM 146 / M1) TaxID=634498 RepID=D3E293_METRM|nr:hypothetical protein [Methanobrevibacter ruminantium]ADC46654.1 hypothetical protein mru_0803 [Methanobrevibacter ruminantium M1]
MTSEIMILTPTAVVLAADSAVTISDIKTYDGANKLFYLSNKPPMGALIYNLADFVDIPIETIIKEFRRKIDGKEDLSLIEIKDEFEKYLHQIISKSRSTLSFQEQLDYFIEFIQEELSYVDFDEFKIGLKDELSDFDIGLLGDFKDEVQSQIDLYEDKFSLALPDDCNGLDEEDFISDLKKLFICNMFLMPFIGIAISGFEKDEMFPSFIHFKINYLYDEEFLLRDVEFGSIGDEEVILKALAQDDVINTFLNSIDSKTERALEDFFIEFKNFLFNYIEYCIKSNEDISEENENFLLENISDMEFSDEKVRNIFIGFIECLKAKQKKPILDSISVLPKGELSNLADSLIGITSLRRKIEDEVETVGGPIDVAIITKGDGFVWIKCHDSFDKDLNPQFFDSN